MWATVSEASVGLALHQLWTRRPLLLPREVCLLATLPRSGQACWQGRSLVEGPTSCVAPLYPSCRPRQQAQSGLDRVPRILMTCRPKRGPTHLSRRVMRRPPSGRLGAPRRSAGKPADCSVTQAYRAPNSETCSQRSLSSNAPRNDWETVRLVTFSRALAWRERSNSVSRGENGCHFLSLSEVGPSTAAAVGVLYRR
jgi:hypothetical protein